MKTKVLFVCYGNICRSPLAEFVFRDMVEKRGLQDRIETASCATSSEHIGDPVDPRSQRVLAQHGISCAGKVGRRLTKSDFTEYDYILGMDRHNLEYIRMLCPGSVPCRIGMLMDYVGGGQVADPWYTGDFEKTYRDVCRGCRALLDKIEKDIGEGSE